MKEESGVINIKYGVVNKDADVVIVKKESKVVNI